MILKNLGMQFPASALQMRITLNLKEANSTESLQNAIHDLGLSDIKTTQSPDQKDPVRTKMRLVAPDGTSVQEWQGFVGPVEIGLAIRHILGEPCYSGMESEVH